MELAASVEGVEVEAPADVVGIREAARALNLSPSTLSRQVSDGKIPNRGTADAPKVSLAEVQKAREDNLDASQQRASQPSYAEHRATLEATKAQKAALELAGMLGQTVARAEVEEAIATAARELRDALLRRWRTLAVELEGLSAREIEARGTLSDETALAELVRKLVDDKRDEPAVSASVA